MSKNLILLTIAGLLIFISGVTGQTAEKEKPADPEKIVIDTVKKEVEPKTEKSVIGEWIITPTKYILKGTLVFNDDGNYARSETDNKNTGSTVKGEYQIDKTQKPFAIDLCLNKCGGPGSEWTTMFGIMRFLDDGRLEIQFSSSDKRPTGFSDKTEGSTYLLTRKEVKE